MSMEGVLIFVGSHGELRLVFLTKKVVRFEEADVVVQEPIPSYCPCFAHLET